MPTRVCDLAGNLSRQSAGRRVTLIADSVRVQLAALLLPQPDFITVGIGNDCEATIAVPDRRLAAHDPAAEADGSLCRRRDVGGLDIDPGASARWFANEERARDSVGTSLDRPVVRVIGRERLKRPTEQGGVERLCS
jgi:hypothetical protein